MAETFSLNKSLGLPLLTTDNGDGTALLHVKPEGAFDLKISAPSGPFAISVFTASSAAQNPLPSPLANRVSVSIRNTDTINTVYFGASSAMAPSASWEIGPSEDFNVDLTSENPFYLMTNAGSTVTVKILEIASQ